MSSELLAAYPAALDAYKFAEVHPEAQRDPSPEELLDDWHTLYDSNGAKIVPGALGVMRKTNEDRPWALISVDLCDVVRETARDFMQLGGFTVEAAGESYGYGVPFGVGDQPEVVAKMVQGIMIRDGIAPVEGIETIREILQQEREMGAFIIANTSTLQGCERATLRWMREYLPGCFDGLVLPRNYDGSGSTTKGTVKLATASELKQLGAKKTINYSQHLDDAPHHIRGVREVTRDMQVNKHDDFTPRYIWNTKHTDLNHTETPLEAFERSYDALTENRS
jgi:hypothetical protein